MGKITDYEQRIRLNMPFLSVFDWMKKYKRLNQEQLSLLLGTTGSRISEYKSGRKIVTEELKKSIINAADGKIHAPYLEGKSKYMLVENVPSDELNAHIDARNPDYTQLVEDIKEKESANMLELYAHMIRSLDDLRIELKNELAEIRTIKSELQQARNDYHLAIQQLNRGNTYNDNLHLVAAEDTSNPNKSQA
jgi:transcriptional regulator with XRE-family HTH domain